MSFTPTIIINRNDLERAIKEWDRLYLEIMDENDLTDDHKAQKYLLDILDQYVQSETDPKYPRNELNVGGVRLIICQPELTSSNEAVRDCLCANMIEHGIDY